MYGIEKLTIGLVLLLTACADDVAERKEREERQQEEGRQERKAEQEAPRGDAKDFGRDLEKTGADAGDAIKDAGEGVAEAAKDAGDAVAEGVKEVGEDLSDAAVTTRVKAAFGKDASLDATRIDATTVDGVVVLTGTVPSLSAKTHASSVARDIKGVKRVENKLDVK